MYIYKKILYNWYIENIDFEAQVVLKSYTFTKLSLSYTLK